MGSNKCMEFSNKKHKSSFIYKHSNPTHQPRNDYLITSCSVTTANQLNTKHSTNVVNLN